MNKKLLALAVAGAFVAPVAMADSSAVTIYGVASMSVDSVDGGTGGTASVTADNAERRARVSSNTSYIGFKGKEDLGNGLDAHFQIEQTVTLDAGGGSLASGRNNFAGIGSKSWGSLDFGLIDSPLKTSTGKLDLYGGGHTLADYRSLFVQGTTIDSQRQSNSVHYTSPNFNGVTVKLQTAAQQESGSSRSPSFWSGSVSYENGPIFAVVAAEKDKNVYSATAAATVFSVGGQTLTTGGAAGTGEYKHSSWRAGAGYNFGVAKVGVAYSNVKTDATALTGTIGGTLADTTTSTTYKRNAWHVSGEYNVTKATSLGLQYTKASKINDVTNSGANQWTLGVKQAMSKRTTVYALYTQVRNQTGASYALGGGATGTTGVSVAAVGEDPKAVSVGMIHKF